MRKSFWIAFIAFTLWAHQGCAETQYAFDCPETSLKGAIPYSVIGKYKATFDICSGKISYDDTLRQVSSVSIEIETDSIRSNCAWCDKVVKSPKVLETKTYPLIEYNATRFEIKDSGPWVFGELTMHGVTRLIESPFTIQENSDGTLNLQGTWSIPRKEHKIIWNKILDRGGVLVGDFITVQWQVKARKI